METKASARISSVLLCVVLFSAAGVECTSRRGLIGETVFDVTTYGAKPDGKADSSMALIKAWNAACKSSAKAKVVIPKGTFLTGEVVFQGPCTAPAPIVVEIQGTLLAQTDLSAYSSNYWIEFEHVDGVEVTGGGTLDGQGDSVWKFDDKGEKVRNTPLLPVSMIFQSVKNSALHDLNFVNSKGFHTKVSDCAEIQVYNLTITAPGNSPNTDGIHISGSTNVNITDMVIGTGDDCVSIGDGVNNLLVEKVTCGPGHGLSVGSLGKRTNEDSVKGVIVRNCTLFDTTNGARIKTYRQSPSLEATSIVFEDLIMRNVSNPIIIDQQYSSRERPEPSKVKLTDIHFRNIRGTGTVKNPFVTLDCSEAFPCEDVELTDIDIEPVAGAKGPLKSTACFHAKPLLKGKLVPGFDAC